MTATDTTNPYLMALMPLSQATGWTLMLSSSYSAASLYSNVLGMSSFYCAWALYKRFQGDRKELGHISMGLTALAAATNMKWPTAAGVSLVILNFAVIAKLVLVDLSPEDLAKVAKKSVIWAYVFKAYFISSIFFWSTVLYKLVTVNP